MERHPSHLNDDPNLRDKFCQQVSLDEYTEQMMTQLESETGPPELISAREKLKILTPQRRMEIHMTPWAAVLDADTNLSEVLYLSGLTDLTARQAHIDQMRVRWLHSYKAQTN
jgi:hypothetical protein